MEEQFLEEGQNNKVMEQKNYRYMKYELGKNEYFVRVNLEGYVMTNSGEVEEVMGKVLNEYDLSQDMRQKLISNKGQLITNESKNNLCKICKWLC